MDSLPESTPARPRTLWVTPEQAALWQEFVMFAYEFGLLEQDEVEQVLRGYIMRDEQGAEWAIGADTRQWYRREAQGAWVLAEPPPALRPPELDLGAFRRESSAMRAALELEAAGVPSAAAETPRIIPANQEFPPAPVPEPPKVIPVNQKLASVPEPPSAIPAQSNGGTRAEDASEPPTVIPADVPEPSSAIPAQSNGGTRAEDASEPPTVIPAERRCPTCNRLVPPGKRFCGNDGTPIP